MAAFAAAKDTLTLAIVNRGGGYGYDIDEDQFERAARRAGWTAGLDLRIAQGQAVHDALAGADVVVGWDIPQCSIATSVPPPRVVHLTGVGLDRFVPLDWLPEGTLLTNSAGAHAGKVREIALMTLLMAQNGLPAMATAQRERRWAQTLRPLAAGTRVLVAGLGTIGSAAASTARSLGMQVTGIRRSSVPHPEVHCLVPVSELNDALADTDILVAALPATSETRGLFNAGALSCLPVTATVLSLGRSACFDLQALQAMLECGSLGGAILDGFPEEPIPHDSTLWGTRNLFILPHISAGDAAAFVDASLDMLFDNLKRLAKGEPLRNLVHGRLGY